MTIAKSKKGNIYLRIDKVAKTWMEEISGFEVSEDGKIAFFKPEKVETYDHACAIYHTAIKKHGRNYFTEEELSIWHEMNQLLAERTKELKQYESAKGIKATANNRMADI